MHEATILSRRPLEDFSGVDSQFEVRRSFSLAASLGDGLLTNSLNTYPNLAHIILRCSGSGLNNQSGVHTAAPISFQVRTYDLLTST